MASKQVAKTKVQLPANPSALERMKRDAGRGVSTKAADNLVPLLQVLQPLSPQVLKKNQAHIEDASAGDFIIKALADPIIKGDEGFYFQPVAMYQEWVEWVPRERGGGFAGRYPYNDGKPPAGAKAKPQKEGSNRPAAYTINGNDLVDTRYVPGYMWLEGDPVPFVIPFTSTGHAVARSWMSKQTRLQLDGEILPAFAAVYLLKTAASKNNLGEWFKIDVGAPITLFDLATGAPNPEAEELVADCDRAYELGDQLNTAFKNQEKVAHFEQREENNDDRI